LPKWRNKGVGSTLIAYAEKLAKENGFLSVKLDVTSSCNEGIMLLMKHKYRFAGNVFMNTQKVPINCYEKKI
jgi:GNAT superfamily N-acetyltransferase